MKDRKKLFFGCRRVLSLLMATLLTWGCALPAAASDEEEKTGRIALITESGRPDFTERNSSYALCNARYGIFTEPDGNEPVAVLTTKDDGTSDPLAVSPGTYYCKELSAPSGYRISSEVYALTVEENKTATVQAKEYPQHNPISVLLKRKDAMAAEGKLSGATSLANAVYSVTFFGGQFSSAEEALESGTLLKSWSLVTDETGCIKQSDEDAFLTELGETTLPLGTLLISETQPSEGYMPDSRKYLVSMQSGSEEWLQNNIPVIASVMPILGGVQIRMQDLISEDIPQGDGDFEGAEFSVVNSNPAGVFVGGIEYASGTVCLQFSTDESGLAQSALRILPYGDYTLKETKSPKGYSQNESWSSDFSVTRDGIVVNLGSISNRVLTGNVQVRMLEGAATDPLDKGNAALSGAEITVINRSVNPIVYEGQVILPYSDAFDREEGENGIVKRILTDDNGLAEIRGLPYGSYDFLETTAPKGYLLNESVGRTAAVHGEETILLEVENARIDELKDGEKSTVNETIHGTLSEKSSGLHITQAKPDVTLSEKVSYTGLDPSRVYELHAILTHKESGKSLTKGGMVVESYLTFQPNNSSGTAELDFDFDASSLAGRSFVACVSLSADGKTFAEENDSENAEQTIHFPAITSFASDRNGEKTLLFDNAEEDVLILDTLYYENLIPGETYTVSGILRDRSNGGVLRREDGEAYVEETSFVAGAENGNIRQAFTLKGKQLAGKRIVVSETLLCHAATIAIHNSLENNDQTVECRYRSKVFMYDGADHKPLSGAVFTASDITDPSITQQTMTSDESGYASFAGIPGHSYVLQELQAPPGYLVEKETLFTVKVLPDGTLEGDTEIPNAQGGTVILSKSDMVSGKPLADCEIAVYDANHHEIIRSKTDERGHVYLSGLLPGTYYFRETASCSGYYLNEEEYSFEISKEQLVSGTVHLENVPYGTVVLKKTDKAGNGLPGAQIAVYDRDGKCLGRGVSESNGRVYFVSPGAGDYYAVEEVAPAGYRLDSAKHYFSIAKDFVVNGDLTIINTRQSGNVSTGDNSGLLKYAVLAGVLFLITVTTAFALEKRFSRKEHILEEDCEDRHE